VAKVQMVDTLEVDTAAAGIRVIESDWFRHFLRPFQEVPAGLPVITVLVHHLGDDCWIGFLDVRQPSPDVGFFIRRQLPAYRLLVSQVSRVSLSWCQ